MSDLTSNFPIVFQMSLRSRVSGRDRWDIPCLLSKEAWAAAVEMLLRGMPGILSASANAVTGRLLIEYSAAETEEPVENLIRQALSYGPLTTTEMESRGTTSRAGLARSLGLFVGAEIGCTLLKLTFLSLGCPAAGAATALGLVVFAAMRSGNHGGHSRHAKRSVVDETGRVGDHHNRAEVV